MFSSWLRETALTPKSSLKSKRQEIVATKEALSDAGGVEK